MAQGSWPRWITAFWDVVKKFDKGKLNSLPMAARNALGVMLPLGIGMAAGHPLAGLAGATGALNVSFSDGRDPYAHRARRMLAWSLLGAFATFLGSVTGNYHALAVLVAFAWSLVAGLLVAISTRAGDLGLNTLVTIIVYGARGAMPPKMAFYTSLVVLVGGLLQTALALLVWPLRRSTPEGLAIGGVYLDLASQVEREGGDVMAAPLKSVSADVQDTLSALGRDHSLEGERFRLLYDQVDRVRFSIFAVERLRGQLEDASKTDGRCEAELQAQSDILALTGKILRAVAHSLIEDDAAAVTPEMSRRLDEITDNIQTCKGKHGVAGDQLASAIDTLAGQLRLVTQLAAHATSEGAEEFAKHELAPPLKLQMRSWIATLRANLHFQSPAFRHAVRLAVCVAIGTAIGRSINTQRNYWLPMTIAVVLKPDFTQTISRGFLRLFGTLAGLAAATFLYHFLPHSPVTEVALIGAFALVMRYAGPANYAVLSGAVGALVVFLIALTGVSPVQVAGQRAVNTIAGGLLALAMYTLWPTWERALVSDSVADMVERTREYFQAVVRRIRGESGLVIELELDRARDAWRQSRSQAEASVDRVSSEPGADEAKTEALTSILASSHAFVLGVMSLEAFYTRGPGIALPAALEAFACDVDLTLYYVAATLRGSGAAAAALPNLREDHRLLVDAYRTAGAKNIFLLMETDRLTVSLNTMREQSLRLVALVRKGNPIPLGVTQPSAPLNPS